MSSSCLRIVDEVGEAGVYLHSLLRRGELVCAGRQQRMGEHDPVAVQLDDLGLERRHERHQRIRVGRTLDQRGRGMREGRGDEKDVARLGWQGQQPCVDEIVEGLRHRKRLPGFHGDVGAPEHPHDLERVERVPPRGRMDLAEKWSRECCVEVVADDVMEPVAIERADLELVEAGRVERAAKLVHERALRRGPSAGEHTDAVPT